jgi:hypothetical protein
MIRHVSADYSCHILRQWVTHLMMKGAYLHNRQANYCSPFWLPEAGNHQLTKLALLHPLQQTNARGGCRIRLALLARMLLTPKLPNVLEPRLRRGVYIKSYKKTPWPESASELCRPSDHRLSVRLVPNSADRGCHVVSVTEPYGRILEFLGRNCYFFFQVAPQQTSH